MLLNLNEIKNNLSKGDLQDIAIELKEMYPNKKGFSYSNICAVLQGKRKNKKILNALLQKAESNKMELIQFENRTKNLKK